MESVQSFFSNQNGVLSHFLPCTWIQLQNPKTIDTFRNFYATILHVFLELFPDYLWKNFKNTLSTFFWDFFWNPFRESSPIFRGIWLENPSAHACEYFSTPTLLPPVIFNKIFPKSVPRVSLANSSCSSTDFFNCYFRIFSDSSQGSYSKKSITV